MERTGEGPLTAAHMLREGGLNSKFLPSTYCTLSGKAQAKTTPPLLVTTYWRLSSS
jgi:hypothetical protein